MVGCPSRRHARSSSSGGASRTRTPKLADGVSLLGEYAGSGYETPQYLARRPGGQLVQLSDLLHHVADECDGQRDSAQVAERVSATYGKTVSADNVDTLVRKLQELGILAAPDGSSPEVQESDPLLGLKLRSQVLSPATVQRLTRLVRPVFWPPLVLAVIAALLATDVWLFFVHGVGGGLRSSVEQPLVFLLVVVVIVVSAGLHEFGHAAACAYGGAKPGGMGAGIYVIWPAFYTDVTDAYQLDRRGRLRTDLGGVYVNAMIVIGTALTYALTRYEPLVLICFLLQIQVLQQMLPFLRLDGYYVVSDLVGVPDLFRRIGPVLRSAIPFRTREPEVTELKPWVRRVVAGWVFFLVPILGLNLGYFLLSAPRIVATSWDSGARFVGQITTEGGATAVFAAVQLVLLLLPTIGISYTALRFARRGTAGAWRWSAGSVGRRGVVFVGIAAVLGLLSVAWYPDSRVTPYRQGETGTVQQQVGDLSAFGDGAPLLRSPRQAQQPLEAVPAGTSAVSGSTRSAPGTQEPAAAPVPGTSPSPGAPSGSPSEAPTPPPGAGASPGTATDPTAGPSAAPSTAPTFGPSPDASPDATPAPAPATTSATSASTAPTAAPSPAN